MSTPTCPATAARPSRLRSWVATVSSVGVLAGAAAWGASAYFGVPVVDLVAHGPQRVLPAVPVPEAGGTFAFLRTQPTDPTTPVTYNPCRPVDVVYNPAQAPAGADALVSQALHRVSRMSGLALRLVGTTARRPDTRPSAPRLTTSVERPPVLIAWATPEEVPGLAGNVAGLGGSTARSLLVGSSETYATGAVVLDAPALSPVMARPGGPARVRAVLLHELGHVVGLDHVADPDELMYRDNVGTITFGPGDREGLARLGAGPCRG